MRAIALCLLALQSWAWGSIDLYIDGERLWLRTEEAPLTEILHRFAQAGVRVQVDPALNHTITARVVDQDLERSLARLLEPHSYVLIWELLDGPLGTIPRLAEIQVFQPGQRDRIQPLDTDGLGWSLADWPGAPGIEYVRDEIVVGFRAPVDRNALQILIRELGATLVEGIPDLGLYRLRLSPGTNVPALVHQLQRNPLIAAVEPNYAYRLPAPATSAPVASAPPARTVNVAAGSAPIAIIDSGVSAWPGLETLVVGGFNALDPDAPPIDDGGHGTQMALIASGAVSPSGSGTPQDAGVAVLGIRTFDENGVTSNFAVMRSLLHAVNEGARVVNMSWGSPAQSAFLEQAVSRAQRDGALLVAAVGNEPSGTPMFPAAFEQVIGVAALDPDGRPWTQSNYGNFVTLAAPGHAVLPVGYRGAAGQYSGTSIASAHAANALGHYLVQHPDADSAEALAALLAAVNPEGAEWDPRIGHGRLDERAWQRLLTP